MIVGIYNWIKWRTSRTRVRNRADAFMRWEGEHAFFHAQARAWRANGAGSTAEGRFWEAVSVEISRRIQRQAILEQIMTPLSRAPRPAAEMDPLPEIAEPAGSEPTRRDLVYLVHYRPAAAPTHESPRSRRPLSRRAASLESKRFWRRR